VTKKELCEAIGELLASMQVPRSLGALKKPYLPGVEEAWDKVHGEIAFGYPSAHDYANALESRFVRARKVKIPKPDGNS
jgi:hypothetical protein